MITSTAFVSDTLTGLIGVAETGIAQLAVATLGGGVQSLTQLTGGGLGGVAASIGLAPQAIAGSVDALGGGTVEGLFSLLDTLIGAWTTVVLGG